MTDKRLYELTTFRLLAADGRAVQLGGNGASTAQALKMLDYFLATDLLL